MTSRNEQKLQHLNSLDVDNSMINHKHRRHHDSSGVCPMDGEYNLDKPPPVKREHKHEHKIVDDGASDVQNHAIQSISGLLRTERHHSKKPKTHKSPDPKLYSDAVITMNHLCENCHLPKLSESGENSKSVRSDHALLTTKSKANLKFFNTKLSTSKHVQTSRTKMKQKRLKQGDEIKHHNSRSMLSRKMIGKSKKEIYIITGGDTPFKFTTLSQEHIRGKHKRQSDRKAAAAIETKLEGTTSIDCDIKPINERSSRDTVCLTSRLNTSSEILKHGGALTFIPKDKNNFLNQTAPLNFEEKSRREQILEASNRPTLDNDKENKAGPMVTVATYTGRHVFSKYKDKPLSANQQDIDYKKRDYPKVLSSKLKHKHKKSDATLSDRTKSAEERSQKRHRRERRHKHARNNDFQLPLAEICTESEDKLQTTKRISSLLKEHSIQSNFRKQRVQHSQNLPSDDLELRRKSILNNIEKAYSKHKHILPKEAVDALDRNIKQWRNMDLEICKKSSDQMSNVLDLEEVLKKNNKVKSHFREGSIKHHHSEKTTTTTSESTLPSGLKKVAKPQNDLILLNAIVTGINNIDCDKDTVHVNKIPKFVRLEEIACEPDTSRRVLSKINVIEECASEPKAPLEKYPRGAIPKTKQANLCNDDVRKEVSFSQLNVQPTESLYNSKDHQLNYIDGLQPTLLREKRFMKPKKKKSGLDKDILNIFVKKAELRDQKTLDATIKLENDDSIFNVDGVEPLKKQKPNTATAYVNKTNNLPDLKKLELVILPVLEVRSHLAESESLNEGLLSTSASKLIKNTRTQTRKKENHRMQKSSRSSASSSESTVQLMNLLDSPVKIHSVPRRRKRGSDLKKVYISDKEAIAALKYLPPQHNECYELAGQSVYRRKKLQKIILSTIEIKSEILTTDDNKKSSFMINKNVEKSVEERTPKIRKTPFSSKKTEFLYKPNQEAQLHVIDVSSYCLNNSNYPLSTLITDQSLEDYVTNDKYDETKPDRSQNTLHGVNLNVIRKSNHSVCSSIDDKLQNKMRPKSSLPDSGGVRCRMMSYSRNVEQRKKLSRGSTGSSRDSSNDRESNSAQKTFTKVLTNSLNLVHSDEKPKRRSHSLSEASTSSGVSVNSESEKQSDQCKLNKKVEISNQTKVNKEPFDTIKKDSMDTVKPASEVISAALTKITEETISQDTLNSSEYSQGSKKEEPKSLVTEKPEKSFIREKEVKFDVTKVQQFEQEKTSKTNNMGLKTNDKMPKSLKCSLPSTSKPKRDEFPVEKDDSKNSKKPTPNSSTKNALTANKTNLIDPKEETKDSSSLQSFKEEELRMLTESVKKSIINEMQAINTMNIQTLMQLIMKKKEESDKNNLEDIIAKNIENVLKKRQSCEHQDYKRTEKKNADVQPAQHKNLSGDFKPELSNKLLRDDSLDFNDCASIKSARSKKSDRTTTSAKSIKSLMSDGGPVKKQENPFNTQKVQIVNNCNVNNKTSDSKSINLPSTSGEKSANTVVIPKTKRISKLVRSIPRSVLNRNKDSLTKTKPSSAPTGLDKSKLNFKFKKNDSFLLDKSMNSETKTSLTSTRVGSAKETFRTSFISSKDAKTLSKFEKRKQYGELLRQKSTKSRNDHPSLTLVNQNSVYSTETNLADGDNVVQEPVEFQESPQNNDKILSSCSSREKLLDVIKLVEASSQIEDAAKVTKPVESQTQLNKPTSNTTDEVKTIEAENIFQTFTVMADHPHIIDVFRNKFRKTTSLLSTSDKESLYSMTNEKTAENAKASGLLSFNKTKSLLRPLETKYKNETGLGLSYEFLNSTSKISCSPKSSSTDHSLTNLNKLSRVKINLLEACQQLCQKDDRQQKYTLYSPYTSYGKNTAEKDSSPETIYKHQVDNNLHRCKQKFNIHSINHDDETGKSGVTPKQSSSKQQSFSSNTTSSGRVNAVDSDLPIRLSRFVQREERERQGNYVVFKIDKKLQLREKNSTTRDTSRECFKIFMNNNIHKMQLDSDYPLRFSEYGFKSQFFYHNNFFGNRSSLSETGKSGSDYTSSKECSMSKEISTNSSKSSFATVITFPFNLKMTSNSTDLNSSNILSAERDSVSDVNVNETKSRLLPKSRLEQLCDSVTNLYKSLCNAKSAEKLNSECDTGYLTDYDQSQYTTTASTYFHAKKVAFVKNKREKQCSSKDCTKPHFSKRRTSDRDHSANEKKTVDTNLEMTKSSKSINTQTAEKSHQEKSSEKKRTKRDDGTSKSYDHKQIQANIKRKHKRSPIPTEFTSRSTSYNSIKNEEELLTDLRVSQLVHKTELMDLLQSNQEFYALVTEIIKQILTNSRIFPKETSDDILKSMVEEAITTDFSLQTQRSSSSIAESSKMYDLGADFINQVGREKMEIKDLQQQLITEKHSVNSNVSYAFEELIMELLHNVLKKVVDVQQTNGIVDQQKSRGILNKTEEINNDTKFKVEKYNEKVATCKLSGSVLPNFDLPRNSISPQESFLLKRENLLMQDKGKSASHDLGHHIRLSANLLKMPTTLKEYLVLGKDKEKLASHSVCEDVLPACNLAKNLTSSQDSCLMQQNKVKSASYHLTENTIPSSSLFENSSQGSLLLQIENLSVEDSLPAFNSSAKSTSSQESLILSRENRIVQDNAKLESYDPSKKTLPPSYLIKMPTPSENENEKYKKSSHLKDSVLLRKETLSEPYLGKTSFPSQESVQLKGKLSLQEKQSLVSDLKAFGSVLTDLKRSITGKQSDQEVVEFCTLKTPNWKLVHKTTYKPNAEASASTIPKKRQCKCKSSKSLEPNELLQMMSKLPLSTIMTLYNKVTSSNDPEISFESLIQELHETNLLKTQLEKTTESQDCILKALQSSTSANKEEASTYARTAKPNTETIQKEKGVHLSKLRNDTQTQNTNLKMSGSLDKVKLNEKQSNHLTAKKINEKEEVLLNLEKQNVLKASVSSDSSSVKSLETTKQFNKPFKDENKRQALNKIKQNLTDKELFDKLLQSYENEEKIVHRLSNDEEFLKSQLQMVKNRQSIEGLLKQPDLPVTESVDQVVEELENIDKAIAYKTREEKPSISLRTVKKTPSKFLTLKTRVSRLFKSNNHESIESVPQKKNSSVDDSKLKLFKSKNLEKLKKDETSLSSNDSDLVKPQEIGKYFKRGFRGDQVFLNGAKPSEQKSFRDDTSIESIIEFSERDTPLEYLLALGYSIEEASNAIRDEDVENRLFAAITEARIWVNQVNSVQGILLYLIAYKAKPKIMRYYLQLVEAIINNRINNAVKLDSFLKVLEKVEDGDISMLYILGSGKFEEEEENEEYILKKQLRKVFIDVYRIAEHEATLKNETLTKNQINLLKMLAAKYRAGLQPHLEIIALYIGKGLLRSQVQLEAAMIYFSRLDSLEINLARFEKYCGIKSYA